jgi:hypothetical protein
VTKTPSGQSLLGKKKREHGKDVRATNPYNQSPTTPRTATKEQNNVAILYIYIYIYTSICIYVYCVTCENTLLIHEDVMAVTVIMTVTRSICGVVTAVTSTAEAVMTGLT